MKKILIITFVYIFSAICALAGSENSKHKDIDVLFQAHHDKANLNSFKDELFEYMKCPENLEEKLRPLLKMSNNEAMQKLLEMAKTAALIIDQSGDRQMSSYPLLDKETKVFKEFIPFMIFSKEKDYIKMASFLKNGLYKFKEAKPVGEGEFLLVFEEVEVYKEVKKREDVIPKKYISGEFYDHLVKYVCSPFGGISKGNVYSLRSGYSATHSNLSMILILQRVSENSYLITLNSRLANVGSSEVNPNVFYLETTDRYGMGDGIHLGDYECTGVFTYTTNQGFKMSIPSFKKISSISHGNSFNGEFRTSPNTSQSKTINLLDLW